MNWLGVEEASMVLMERRSGELGDKELAAIRLMTTKYDDSVMLLNFFTRFMQDDTARDIMRKSSLVSRLKASFGCPSWHHPSIRS